MMFKMMFKIILSCTVMYVTFLYVTVTITVPINVTITVMFVLYYM